MADETANTDIPKIFEHLQTEPRIWSFWERHRIFDAEVDPAKKPFCVVIPPPNVTGILHMGHILDNVPQDAMTRWHRMRGFSAVWIPGTDHAGIATQNVVKKQLDKEGIDIRDLGREKFVERVWEWREKHGGIIIGQLKRLGCSCDWRRERFTLDEGLSRAVLQAFIHYYDKGLIYRGKRMINWCTICGTALANDEVEHEEKDSHLWHLRYPILKDDGTPSGEHVVVATTRPETMLGDTAVAVNPNDERYKSIIGRQVLLPLQNRPIPVIADSFVDVAFGTGVVKVTPAHDPNDYQMGLAHKLAIEKVIGDDGKMTPAAGAKYSGMDRFQCRKAVVSDLESLGYLEKIERYKHAVGQCYRCNSVVEPLISDQWFVRMKPLAEKAKQAVLDGRITIVPESERQDYFHWMDTIQDWCISRQLWWGHRIPVYYCEVCGHMMAKLTAPAACEKCSAQNLRQDEDVLDTWFSSQLWPFSTLGWPDKTPELAYWYPNTWLMSGRDILFFWDARMIMSGLELMGDVPFKTLALHGLVRDDKGRKLSKSLGNSPDPLKLFDEYGTDAVRGAIAGRYPMGRQDTKLAGDFCKNGQALITKIWNASRLMLMNVEADGLRYDSSSLPREALEDRWIISRLRATIESHDKYLSDSDMAHAFEALTNFFWGDYCDWYLEIIKPRMREQTPSKAAALQVSLHVLRTLLKLFHPYIPFVTEELWQIWQQKKVVDTGVKDHECLALSPWPDPARFAQDHPSNQKMETMMSIVRGMRDVRANLLIAPKLPLDLRLRFLDSADSAALNEYEWMAQGLAFSASVELTAEASVPAGFVPFRFVRGLGYVRLPADVNAADMKAKLESKISKIAKALEQVNQRLASPAFVDNAPPELVEQNRASAREYQESIEKLQAFSSSL